MGQPKDYPVEKWEDFTKLDFARLVVSPFQLTYIFRGEPKAYPTPLLPSLLRPSRAPKSAPHLTEAEALDLEKGLTRDFQRDASLQVPVPTPLDDVVTWWLWMQHYGAPTRLLDWSRSQYVAAYFAVRDHFDEDGFIWALNPHIIPAFRFPVFPPVELKRQLLQPGASLEGLALLSHATQTPRMLAQQTMFTCSMRILGEPHQLIETSFPESDQRYCRIVIPSHQKMVFLTRLAAMNVTATSLFPGLEGTARAAIESAELFRRFKEGAKRASARTGPSSGPESREGEATL